MAYTIVKSDGVVLTTIADGTINTTSTSIGLPGRNYPGYGQVLDTNFVHILENFADDNPPQNPIVGQLWYDTNANILYVCPIAGAVSELDWLPLATSSSNSVTTFGAVTVTGNLTANNIIALNNVTSSNLISAFDLSVSNTATIVNADVTTADIGTLTTTVITTGANTTAGSITGTWTLTGGGTANAVAGTSMWITGGNLVITGGSGDGYGLRTDNLMYANGANIFGGGAAYSNSNVASYLPTYSGNVGSPGVGLTLNGNVINAGANTTTLSFTGYLTGTNGSRLILTDPNTSGNIANLQAGTITTTGNITTSANIYANSYTIGAALLSGVLNAASASQPNITSVGTLTGLTVNGTVDCTNITFNGNSTASTGFYFRSVGTGITAAGATQAGATALTKEINIVSSVVAGTGVRLPTGVAGMVVIVNNTGANPLNVFPATGASINSLSVNTAFAQPVTASIQFYAVSSTQWYTVGATYA